MVTGKGGPWGPAMTAGKGIPTASGQSTHTLAQMLAAGRDHQEAEPSLCFHCSPRPRCWLALSQLPEAETHRAPQLADVAPAPKVLPDESASCSLSTFIRLPCCSPLWRSLPLFNLHLQPCLHSLGGICEEQDMAEGPGAVVRSGPWKH